MSPYRSRRERSATRPFVAFLLITSFGILFAGCSEQTIPEPDVFTFTADDVARFRELVGDGQQDVPSALVPRLEPDAGSTGTGPVVLDVSLMRTYDAIRSGPGATGENVYRVTNAFLNVRTEARITAPEVARLEQGDTLQLVDFVDGAWAKVQLADGREGYIAHRYVAKLTSEEKLAEERKKFEGLYFVDFSFLNVRAAPDSQSEKLGELPAQTLVRPLSIDGQWARLTFASKEGYASTQYLSPFAPNFLVRQDAYTLPILHYRLGDDATLLGNLPEQVAALRAAGVTLITLAEFRDLILRQQERDVRLQPRTAVLAISGITPDNAGAVSDALVRAKVKATLFIESRNLGLSGITERVVLNLQANGGDIQSAGVSGEDLRSLTNSQIDLELGQSRKIIEEMTRKDVFAIGYALGGVNERVLQKAAEAGYLFGLGSAPGGTFRREQFLRLPSFPITTGMSGGDVAQIVTGQ